MTPKQLHILQHSLGVDKYGQGEQYRNHFITDPTSPDGVVCEELVTLGLMRNCGSNAATGGMNCYRVNLEGVTAMHMNSPAPPKLTRSQKRYREFMDADCGVTFREWLGLTKKEIRP